MKNLFIIYTPYQMMSALNIIEAKNDKCVLLFVNENLEKFKLLCEKINNVRVIIGSKFYHQDRSVSPFRMRIDVFIEIFVMKQMARNASFLDEVIDNLYVPSDEVICRAIFNRCRKINPNLRLFLIDDGAGTYNSDTFRKGNVLGGIIYRLMLDSDYKRAFSSILCYHPDLLVTSPYDVTLKPILPSENVRMLFSEYVKDKISIYKDKKIVFLDQGYGSRSELKNCLKVIHNYFKPSEVLIKIHPRIISNNYDDYTTSKDGLPFESIVSACKFNDCLIITWSSSGAINPFLIYGEHTNVVLLCKISANNTLSGSLLNRYFDRVKERMGTSLFIPESIEEFDLYLKRKTEIKGISLY